MRSIFRKQAQRTRKFQTRSSKINFSGRREKALRIRNGAGRNRVFLTFNHHFDNFPFIFSVRGLHPPESPHREPSESAIRSKKDQELEKLASFEAQIFSRGASVWQVRGVASGRAVKCAALYSCKAHLWLFKN